MGLSYETTTGSGAGFTVGPEQNVFTGATRAIAESARDTYATDPANSAWLPQYNSDTSLNIRLEFTENSEQVAQYQVRNSTGTQWVDNQSFQALQGLPGDAASLASVTVGHVPFKDTDNTFGDSGMQVLGDGTVLAPRGFGVESASIDFGDITRVSEANSFLRITNSQFPATAFDLIDARQRPTGVSSRPRQFFLTEAENEVVLQSVDTETITTNPLTFNYTATLNAQTNSFGFRTGSAMTNVRMKVSYVAAPQEVVKYIPDKASWLEGAGGVDLPIGPGSVDLEDSPLRAFQGDQYSIEVRADNIAFLGNTGGIPYISANLQRGEFRELSYTTDVNDGGTTTASQVSVADTDLTGVLVGSGNAQEAFDRLDATGIGSAPRTFTGSFLATYGVSGNQDTWYGGRQNVNLVGARGQANGQYTFRPP